MGDFPTIPGYSILRILGEGGIATVYLAVQDNLNREVALKVMHVASAQDERIGERFLREARIVARLTHPHIVPLYDVGKVDNYYFLSMEYLPKHDLTARIKQGMTAGQILRVAKSIASALDAAHQKSYIHRDVKPDNILFRADGTPVLTDFGIAKPISDGMAMEQIGEVMGIPHYMSPEQIRGESVDHRCDLYALGVVIYEMLTGQLPYQGDSASVVGMKHLQDPIPRLPVNRAVFQHLIDGLLAKDKTVRIGSAKQVVTALDAVYAVLRRQADAKKAQVKTPAAAAPQAAITPEATEILALDPLADGAIRADSRDREQEYNAEQEDAQAIDKNHKPLVATIVLVLLLGLSAAIYYAPSFAANTPLMAAHNMLKSLLVPVEKVDVKQEKIKQLLAQADAAVASEHYVMPLSGSALEAYRAVLSLDEFNLQAKLGMDSMSALLLDKANAAIDAEDFEAAEGFIRQVRSIAANAQGLMSTEMRLRRQQQISQEAQRQQRLAEQQAAEEAARQEELRKQRQAALERQRQQRLKANRDAEKAELAQQEAERAKQQAEADAAAAMFTNIRIRGLLAKAETYYTRGEFHVPVGENALAAYAEVLELDAANTAAQEGLQKTVDAIIKELEVLLANQRVNEAQALYSHVLSIAKDNSALYAFAQRVGW